MWTKKMIMGLFIIRKFETSYMFNNRDVANRHYNNKINIILKYVI